MFFFFAVSASVSAI